MSNTPLHSKKTELVPPDGGWGYLICVSGIIVYTITAGIGSSFGLVYNDFMVEVEMGTTTVGLVTGAGAMSLSVSGFLTSSLLKVMSFRQLALAAAILHNIGTFGLLFAHSIFSFFVCQALLQSCGYGILYNLTCTILNQYFLDRRFLALATVQTATAILSMCVPVFVKFTLEAYGYRGMLLIISAITMHLFVAVALMQPVTWHMKQRELLEESAETKVLLVEGKKVEDVPVVKITSLEGMTTEEKIYATGENNIPSKAEKESAVKKVIQKVVDPTLLKEFLPDYACTGLVLGLFGDYAYTMMVPQALYAQGWSQGQVARALSLMGFGDVMARAMFVSCSKWLQRFKSSPLHFTGVLVAIAARVGMFITKEEIGTLVFLFISGVSRCFLATLIPLVIAEEIGPDKFTAAMGIFMLLIGSVNLSLGPVIGLARDATGSYDTVMWISFGLLSITMIMWLAQLCCKKYKLKKKHEK